MRHRKSGRKFGMDSSARKAMLRNMVTSLLVHGQIKTTAARAKELRRHAERLISIGKRAPSAAEMAAMSGDELARARAHRVAAIRRLKQVVQSDEAVHLVMGDYAERYRERPGGYTRVLKLGRPRPGDNAPMAVISLVTEAVEPKQRRAPQPETAPAALAAEGAGPDAGETSPEEADAPEGGTAGENPTADEASVDSERSGS